MVIVSNNKNKKSNLVSAAKLKHIVTLHDPAIINRGIRDVNEMYNYITI